MRANKSWRPRGRIFWDAIASDYQHLYSDPWSRLEDEEVGSLIAGLLRADDTVLDLGCGQGLGARLIVKSGSTVKLYVGLDISWQMLKLADVSECSPAVLIQADMLSIPLNDGTMSIVISLYGSMSYIEGADRAFQEMARVLKPGGHFLVMFLSRWSLRRLLKLNFSETGAYGTYGISIDGLPNAHVRFATKRSLFKELGACELEVMSIFGQSMLRVNATSSLVWSLSRHLGRVFPDLCHALVVVGRKADAADARS